MTWCECARRQTLISSDESGALGLSDTDPSRSPTAPRAGTSRHHEQLSCVRASQCAPLERRTVSDGGDGPIAPRVFQAFIGGYMGDSYGCELKPNGTLVYERFTTGYQPVADGEDMDDLVAREFEQRMIDDGILDPSQRFYSPPPTPSSLSPHPRRVADRTPQTPPTWLRHTEIAL
jgi:hypothetical protein